MAAAVKFYDWSAAPNPRRLRLFIAAKGIDIETEDVFDASAGGLKADFKAKYPRAVTPALELDDGTIIGDAAACMRYLEDTHPDPPLFGSNAKEKALVDMWEHSAYEDGLMAAAETFRNSDASPFPYAIPGVTSTGKIAELIERGKVRTLYFFELLDTQLASNEFVAGDFFSAADITALCAYDFAIGTAVLEEIPGANVARWYAAVSESAAKL